MSESTAPSLTTEERAAVKEATKESRTRAARTKVPTPGRASTTP